MPQSHQRQWHQRGERADHARAELDDVLPQFRETRLLGAMLGAFGGIINATLVTSAIFFEALVMAT